MTGRRILALTGVVVMSAVSVPGCSSHSEHSRTELPISVTRVTRDSQTVTPAVALLPSASDKRLILLAHDTLLAECVGAKGESLSLGETERVSWIEDLTASFPGKPPFGPVDPDRMARYGYHDPEHQLLPRDDVSWGGPPTSSELIRQCDDTVTAGLGGEPPFSMLSLIIGAGRRAGADPRRSGPQRAWVDCMRDKGFDYEATGDPWIEFVLAEGATAPTLSVEEIGVATADADCQAISRSTDTQVALVAAYEQHALEEHAEQVAAYREYLRDLLRRSARIVAEKPAPVNRRETRPDT